MLFSHIIKGLILFQLVFSSLFFPLSFANPISNMGILPNYSDLQATSQFNNISSSIPSLLNDSISKNMIFTRLNSISKDDFLITRGAKETALYKKAASGVVFLVNDYGFGSGVIINNDGHILTNWHVVAGSSDVGVIFKPLKEGQKLTPRDIYRGRVIKVNEISDLALLRVEKLPVGVSALRLGNMNEIQVGADVHAIGHPTGESWTYTKGIISQIRRDYEWTSKYNNKILKHQSTVIQTQTPINPGNSGGPLLSSSGHVVGLNSFKAMGEGLNFAISVENIYNFLNKTDSVYTLKNLDSKSLDSDRGKCAGNIIGEKRNKENNSTLIFIDIDCDGKPDGYFENPDDSTKPIALCIDSKKNNNIDIIIFDFDRDGKWDLSLHDIDGDGKPDLVGYHQDGELQASRFTKYDDYIKKSKR